MSEALAKQWLDELRARDDEATRSRAAFITGRFDVYWQERGNEAQARLDAIYGDNTDGQTATGGDSEPSGDSGGGAGSSG